MSNKETFVQRISEIRGRMSNKELASIMGCGAATVSKYLNLECKDMPPVENLCKLCDHFNVSMDWILGRQTQRNIEGKASPRQICEMLVKMCASSEMQIGSIHKEEFCVEPDWDGVVHEEQKNIAYLALYFPEWYNINPWDDYEYYAQHGNRRWREFQINKFIARFSEINKMHREDNLNDEMYQILLNSYLREVPEK